ncbi:MAG: hypothetical protein ACJ74H_02885 [Thermoanaerobaculia bacterium]
MADDYAKIFVWNIRSRGSLTRLVKQVIAGRSEPLDSVRNQVMEIDVRENEDRRPMRIERKDDFLFAPYYLDVTRASGVEQEDYVRELGHLLVALWNEGVGAVAAAEFEDQLPESGGIQRLAD